MSQPLKVSFAALAASSLLFTAAASADVRLHHTYSADINLRGDDVVITAPDRSEALITPAGDLSIGGQKVALSGNQRELLKKYSAGILDIQERGLRIGQHAVGMVGGMMGTLFSDLMSGDGDTKLDKDMKAKAEPIKDEARALCNDLQLETQLQQQIAVALPAFKPYAVIQMDSANDCRVDDN